MSWRNAESSFLSCVWPLLTHQLTPKQGVRSGLCSYRPQLSLHFTHTVQHKPFWMLSLSLLVFTGKLYGHSDNFKLLHCSPWVPSPINSKQSQAVYSGCGLTLHYPTTPQSLRQKLALCLQGCVSLYLSNYSYLLGFLYLIFDWLKNQLNCQGTW